MIATIYCLLYGDHFTLHRRLLESLFKRLPSDEAHVVIWCNTVCADTRVWLYSHVRADWSVIFSDDNVPKYKVMGELFHGDHAPVSDWVVWFDDDSHVIADNWWQRTKDFLEMKAREGVCYVGQPWYVHHLAGQWDFIKQASWFKGLEPQMCPTKKPGVKRPGIWFAQGSYWWLRTDILRLLNWPDERLNHNGGDTLLGEAVRQQGLPFHRFHYGVKPNDAKRRGLHETPAGSKKNVRR